VLYDDDETVKRYSIYIFKIFNRNSSINFLNNLHTCNSGLKTAES